MHARIQHNARASPAHLAEGGIRLKSAARELRVACVRELGWVHLRVGSVVLQCHQQLVDVCLQRAYVLYEQQAKNKRNPVDN